MVRNGRNDTVVSVEQELSNTRDVTGYHSRSHIPGSHRRSRRTCDS